MFWEYILYAQKLTVSQEYDKVKMFNGLPIKLVLNNAAMVDTNDTLLHILWLEFITKLKFVVHFIIKREQLVENR